MSDNNTIRILFVEDLPFDTELAEMELVKGGIDFVSRRVEKREEFIAALDEFRPDLVISDYSLPQFNGMEASVIARKYDQSLPFIILTGTQNEEIAVECMKAGATDYVMKEHIVKLSFAVKEALRYRDVMREKSKTEAALFESESRYRSMFENNYAVMLLINPEDGTIVDVNPAAAEFYGFDRESFTGKNISEINVSERKNSDPGLKVVLSGSRSHITSRHILRDGVERDVEVFCSPVNYMGKKLVHCIIQDITDRNKAVKALRASLNEKKELIREIYHRTKNNMQVIISMFSLQSVFSDDEKLVKVLKDMESRIRAMSLVHEKLYKSKNLSRLDLKDYLTDLVNNIISGYGVKGDRIEVINEMENIEVLIDTAIPCGLVVNELVSNSARHAFPDENKGKLLISMKYDNSGMIELVIADDGVGRGIFFDFENNESMGLKIVKNIVEYQLKGNFEIDNTEGVRWTIKFKDDVYEERI